MNALDRLKELDFEQQRRAGDSGIDLKVERSAHQMWEATATLDAPGWSPIDYIGLAPNPEVAAMEALGMLAEDQGYDEPAAAV